MRQILNSCLIAAFIVACLVVLALALGPPPRGVDSDQGKLLHSAAFLVLTVLGGAAFHRITVLAPAAGLLVGGILIELAQGLSFFDRSPSVADVVADGGGIGLGIALVWAAKWLVREARRDQTG